MSTAAPPTENKKHDFLLKTYALQEKLSRVAEWSDFIIYFLVCFKEENFLQSALDFNV